MPNLLKLVYYTYNYASRDEREMAAAQEAGFDVTLLSMGTCAEDNHDTQAINGIQRIRFFVKNSSTNPFAHLHTLRRWMKKIRSIPADVISCHDLPALRLAYFAYLFCPKRKKPKWVYDSHEFEIGRNVQRSALSTWAITHQERFLIKRCAFSIMVNDSIADEVQRIHKLKHKPLVIRSTPPKWMLDETQTAKRRQEMLKKLNAPETTFLVMYHGLITTNRGVEQLVEAVAANPKIAGVIMGSSNPEVLESIQKKVRELHIEDRILFLPPVPLKNLWEYVGAADVGIMLFQNTHQSYYYSLPNKFFESIQSLTPVIVSRFPELTKIVERYGIGLSCDPTDLNSLNACIEKMRTDILFYAQCKHNLIAAKNDLCWENEKQPLVEAYKVLHDSV